MAFVRVAQASDFDASPLIEVIIDGNPYALCKVDGNVHAIDGVCPHQGGPLGQGMLNGSSVMCPWHAWEFNCRTGANEAYPEERIAVYPVKVEDGGVFIDVA